MKLTWKKALAAFGVMVFGTTLSYWSSQVFAKESQLQEQLFVLGLIVTVVGVVTPLAFLSVPTVANKPCDNPANYLRWRFVVCFVLGLVVIHVAAIPIGGIISSSALEDPGVHNAQMICSWMLASVLTFIALLVMDEYEINPKVDADG